MAFVTILYGVQIDLCDEVGLLKNLNSTSAKFANEILNKEREKLVLLQVEHGSTENISDGLHTNLVYKPLLVNDNIVTQRFKARLSRRDNSPQKSEEKYHSTRDKSKKNEVHPEDNHVDTTPMSGKYRNKKNSSRCRSRSKK
uniref:Uncharacterized LOC100179601 n=1 Tax=Ciona intestinalis TaxID=7719 RepID=H2XM04_CIOIN|nr:uncharacterized protein LOC100179601 isoform X2 [Ciona intestinalis]|eukprot:XP_002127330.1 uncharacterized protein LOC100179601 isoform X2 [Ciona intestinalis]